VVNVVENTPSNFQPLYPLDVDLEEKISIIASKVYGAKDVTYSGKAIKQLKEFKANGWNHFPICMAKTQYSLSDDPTKLGRPEGFTIEIRELKASVGAGFIVALTGTIMTMPGLPKTPAALNMDVSKDGVVKGLF
jgi:formate--tetrahydrofolate ligase